jgi:uncharacterized protein YodC (DUF2158 family)
LTTKPPITITNTDKSGKVMNGRWYVRVGKRWRTFTEKEWVAVGQQWIARQMNG